MRIANATLYLFDATALRNVGERLDTLASPAPRSLGYLDTGVTMQQLHRPLAGST
jgi:hypothetical protein